MFKVNFKLALRWLGVGLLIYVAAALIMAFFEDSLIYFPSRHPDGQWSPNGLAFEDAEFTAADGTRIHGWYVPAPAPRAVALFSHGNGGNLSHRADFVRLLRDRLRISTLIYDYRGYGRSEGTPNEAGLLQDARAARAWLARRAAIAEQEIILFGESLGGAVSVDLAVDGARGLVLQNTFSSLPDVAAYHYTWLPVRLLLRTQFDSIRKISDFHGRLLQFHGDRDEIVPLPLAQRLFAAANEPKRFVLVEGGNHNDPPSGSFVAEMDRFIDQLLAEGAN
jgi:fermentation-respiration switch protein FrsA (DUF1100 family)